MVGDCSVATLWTVSVFDATGSVGDVPRETSHVDIVPPILPPPPPNLGGAATINVVSCVDVFHARSVICVLAVYVPLRR